MLQLLLAVSYCLHRQMLRARPWDRASVYLAAYSQARHTSCSCSISG